ncbi:hypothetical protein C5C31_14730 [Rathayibacter rathayi]|uniref:hypothetical protein n=1 Tax=Rathayibacter rathayi TaxID=33887 RepID=UPI000CE724FB|nr:hypothetical protein [Rathayibacter rathayi]PPG65126.1 hypothetical protein C5C02_14070 [Rathayibacter rathayi]PPG74166.1 hypothetical protein C5C23_13775 [Rathayibacter rathayi]PPH17093.1 hypothetical protein C5C31_14730 [Rathayibacter rathayi]PPI76054.1 hypothetical protein C5E03_11790 [Rathayibacter rathayi]
MTAVGDGERGQHDRQETPEHEELGRSRLTLSFARYDTLAARAEALAVRAGSSLAGDRSATPYRSVPDQVRASLGVALDHLHAFTIIVADGGAVLPFAMFTLVRSAYEATGTALWLLHPTSRDDRVLRSLKLVRDNHRQVHNLMEKSGRKDPGWDRAIAALERDRDGRKALVGVKLDHVSSVTDRLEEIAPLVPELFLTPLALWQTSSGMAHGNSSMTLLLLDREQSGPIQHGGADYNLTTSVLVVAGYFDAALDMIEAALDLWDSRNSPPELH